MLLLAGMILDFWKERVLLVGIKGKIAMQIMCFSASGMEFPLLYEQ